MIRTLLSTAIFASVMIAPVMAQPKNPAGDPVAIRQKMMKQNGADAKAGGQMLKGEIPFDAARAQAIFVGMHDVASKYGNYFPKGSLTAVSEASPAIWTKPAEFRAAVARFEKDSAAAIAAKVSTKEAFGQQFGAVTANCKSCHEAFRIKKE